MMKKMIEFDANVLMGTNENWAVNAPNVVKEHIHYPNRTNNWCLEDQTTFEEELKATNPAYVAFTKFMKENGYAELADRELGTLWVIKRGVTEELVNIGPADTFGKVPTNSFIQLLIENETAEVKKERKKTTEKGQQDAT